MPCNFARFVIHYKDGTTLIEDRSDPYCWDNANKEGITAMGILHDPVPIGIIDPNTKQDIRVKLNQHTLKGSSQYINQFFQMKEAEMKLAKGAKPKTLSLCVGMVVDSDGRCVVMRGVPGGSIYSFFTSVHSLRLNLELFNINLEECGKQIDQK